MNAQVVKYIEWFSHLSVFIPLIIYFRKWKGVPSQHHIIGILILASAGFDTLSALVSSPVVYNIFDALQFALITWFYYKLVYQKRAELIALIAIGIYIALLTYSVVNLGVFTIYSALWSTGSAIILIHSLAYLFNISKMTLDRYFDIHLLSNMLFNVSIFIYFLIVLIISVLFDTVARQQDVASFKAFWAVHNVFNILKNFGFALAFYYTGKRQIYMTLEQLERIARQLELEESED